MEKPLLLIDVDGVISLFGFDPSRPPDGRFQMVDGIAHFLSATAGGHLRDLANSFELAWCTGWEEKANEYLPFALGLPGPLPVIPFDPCDRPTGAHWKLAGIGAYDIDPGRPLAWLDDAHDERCTAWAVSRSGPTLLVSTEPSVGVTDEHVTMLHDWAWPLLRPSIPRVGRRAMNNSGVSRRQLTPLEPLVQRLESASELDGPAKTIGKTVRSATSGQPLKDVLSGTWLGHAVHPMLTDVVIGALLSTTLLDLLGGDESGSAGERLISLGALAYGPTALTGLNDWADTEIADKGVRRVGIIHAAGNATALTLYAGSLIARRRGRRGRARLFSLLGGGVLMIGGYLGGHMALLQGVGPDQTVFDPGPAAWMDAGPASALSDGTPARVVVEDTPVLLVREGDQLFAIHDRCSHRGCSLSDGSIEGDEIVCGCHGSRFDRRTGAVRRGPATAPQPAFEVRERDGTIELRRRA